MNAIQPRPKAGAAAYIQGAPDGARALDGKKGAGKRVRGTPISLTLPEELLISADEVAKAKGLSRASFIKMAIAEAVQKG